jgi:predicted DsbA family dithiol-disulfide isomerase
MMTRLAAVAREENLPFGDRRMTYNSRLAQELGKWAEEKGSGEAFHKAAFRAYFADGLNIGHRAVLLQLAADVGLSSDEAGQVLDTRAYRNAVDGDWQRAREKGITAVPTFVFGKERLVGARPYRELETLLLGNELFPLTPGG